MDAKIDQANPTTKPGKIGYLPTLDGWRAVAIGLVLLEHGRESIKQLSHGASEKIYTKVPALGLYGVRIFFGISGFLICSRLIEETRMRGRVSLKGFYIRRGFRIMPPLLAMLITVLILSMTGVIRVPLQQWIAGLFFAANYVRFTNNAWYLGHLWSLAVEEHFYLIFPAILVLSGVRRGAFIAGIGAIAIAIWRFLAFEYGKFPNGFDGAYFWGRTDIVADGLLWGCVVAFLYAARREWLRSMLKPVVWRVIVFGLLVSIPLTLKIKDWKLLTLLFGIQAAVIPFVLAGTVLQSKSIVGRILESTPLRWVGRLSYSIYLWQQLFLAHTADTAGWLQKLQQFPLNFIMIATIATASYFLLELPTMRMGHRLAKPASQGREELGEKAVAR